ncbi:hypothetical protein J6590_014560 [Homalodisca vitripennis]|nr:hypothetical protein J6590_014560 [Homalodisca vitripennis]
MNTCATSALAYCACVLFAHEHVHFSLAPFQHPRLVVSSLISPLPPPIHPSNPLPPRHRRPTSLHLCQELRAPCFILSDDNLSSLSVFSELFVLGGVIDLSFLI